MGNGGVEKVEKAKIFIMHCVRVTPALRLLYSKASLAKILFALCRGAKRESKIKIFARS